MVSFKAICLSVSFLASDCFLKCLSTVATSQICEYLGCGVLKLHTPFMNQVTKAFVPSVLSLGVTKVDNAQRAVFMYE